MRVDVTLKDFQPFNRWKPDSEGEKYHCCDSHSEKPMYLIDQTTSRRYLNESKGTVRIKSFLLTLGTPFVHLVTLIIEVVRSILKLITLSHFRTKANGEAKFNFKAGLKPAGATILHVIATPFVYLGLEFAAIYGIFSPYNGRKLYATLERAHYGDYVLAPCFQPTPDRHFFGGDLKTRNAY